MLRLCLCAALLTASWSLAHAQSGAAPQQRAALPADFHGKVAYFGNNSGKLSGIRRGAKPMTSKDCPRPDQRCPRLVGGSLEVELLFDGDVVRGRFRGSGGLEGGELIGRRNGSQCLLFDRNDGSQWIGACDQAGFTGAVRSVDNAPLGIELSFTTIGTRTIDFGRIRYLREQRARREARIKLLQQRLESSMPIEYRLEAAVELDSYGWTGDAYAPGTLTALRKSKARNGGRDYSIYAEYKLQGGGNGWVRATVQNDAITCLEQFDAPGICRPILTPLPIEIPAEEDAAAVDDWAAKPAG